MQEEVAHVVKSIYRDEYRVLVQKLVDARKAKGLTQTALSRELAKPQSYVSKYENCERRLDIVEFLDVMKILAINPDIFFK